MKEIVKVEKKQDTVNTLEIVAQQHSKCQNTILIDISCKTNRLFTVLTVKCNSLEIGNDKPVNQIKTKSSCLKLTLIESDMQSTNKNAFR